MTSDIAAPVNRSPSLVLRYATAASLAVALASLHLSHRPPSMCVLRTLTGIPCPFCGGTTAAVDLGRGNLRGAVAASPLAAGLFLLGPWFSWRGAPRWWRVRRHRWLAVGVIVVAAELWQLVRFGIVPH